jgi:cysteinyl-tRNA synthetase
VHALNRAAGSLGTSAPAGALDEYRAGMVVLRELARILGIFRRLPEQPEPGGDALAAPLMDLLIELRARLRKEKNFALADEVRNRLTALGVLLEDRPDGTRWRIEPRK